MAKCASIFTHICMDSELTGDRHTGTVNIHLANNGAFKLHAN